MTRLTDHNIFIILYGVFSVYFAGVMVRLMLVLAPVMCILSGIAVSRNQFILRPTILKRGRGIASTSSVEGEDVNKGENGVGGGGGAIKSKCGVKWKYNA